MKSEELRTVNEDLLAERKKCTFNVQELTHLLDGGEEKTKDRKALGNLILFFYHQLNLLRDFHSCLAYFLLGSKVSDIFSNGLSTEEFFLSDEKLKDVVPSIYLSHKERYEEAIRKSCLLVRKIKEWEEMTNNGGSAEIYQYVLLLKC